MLIWVIHIIKINFCMYTTFQKNIILYGYNVIKGKDLQSSHFNNVLVVS